MSSSTRDSIAPGARDFHTTHWSVVVSARGEAKVAVHRLRERYRALLRAEIAETVAGPEEIEDELRALMAALSS